MTERQRARPDEHGSRARLPVDTIVVRVLMNEQGEREKYTALVQKESSRPCRGWIRLRRAPGDCAVMTEVENSER